MAVTSVMLLLNQTELKCVSAGAALVALTQPSGRVHPAGICSPGAL